VARTTTGRIFNVQRYSIHDGAGIRTLVFLKGCPLRCLWCANPESQKGTPELGYIAARCHDPSSCGAPCVTACPLGAITLGADGKAVVDRMVCDACGKCASVCAEEAFKLVGREWTVDEVLREIEKDRPFYRRSGGGVTIGGGEPLAQPRFTAELLEAAQEEYLHTALETSGYASWPQFERVVRHVDLVQIDLKHMDPERHRALTGHSNQPVLENLKELRRIKSPEAVVVRIPVIPGANDSIENISASASFLARLGFTQVELIPYHGFGISKYDQYGMLYALRECEALAPATIHPLRAIVESFGLRELSGQL
jgi:pyruvate formate lyase activating enzyme